MTPNEALAAAILIGAREAGRREVTSGFEWYGSALDMAEAIYPALSQSGWSLVRTEPYNDLALGTQAEQEAQPEDTRTADPGGLDAPSPITGPVLAKAWALSGRSAPLMEPDEWDGFALTVRAVIATSLTPEATAPDAEYARLLAERDRLAGEYGRLLAERDRLIGEGVDPDDLDMPLPPPDAEGEG